MLMSNPFKTRDFKKLFNEWNQKLKDNGHKEIENFTLPDPALIDHHSLKFTRRQWIECREELIEERQVYYNRALEIAVYGTFKTRSHQKIWELHAEGYSVRNISKRLKKRLSKSKIHRLIQGIKKLNGLG